MCESERESVCEEGDLPGREALTEGIARLVSDQGRV